MKYFKKRKTTKKTVSKQAREVVKASKALMLRQVETKYFPYNWSTALASQTIYSFSPMQQLPIGNTATTRVGDSVILQSLTLSGEIIMDASVLNGKFRIMVGYSRNQTVNTLITSGALSATDLFYAQLGTLPHRIVNPSIWTSLYDEMIDINSNTSVGRDIRSFYVTVGLKNFKFDYAGVGGSIGKLKNLFVVIIPYSPVPGSGDLVGTVQANSCLKFKDP